MNQTTRSPTIRKIIKDIQALQESGVSVRQIADEAGMSYKGLYMIIGGESTNSRIETVEALQSAIERLLPRSPSR